MSKVKSLTATKDVPGLGLVEHVQRWQGVLGNFVCCARKAEAWVLWALRSLWVHATGASQSEMTLVERPLQPGPVCGTDAPLFAVGGRSAVCPPRPRGRFHELDMIDLSSRNRCCMNGSFPGANTHFDPAVPAGPQRTTTPGLGTSGSLPRNRQGAGGGVYHQVRCGISCRGGAGAIPKAGSIDEARAPSTRFGQGHTESFCAACISMQRSHDVLDFLVWASSSRGGGKTELAPRMQGMTLKKVVLLRAMRDERGVRKTKRKKKKPH